MLEKRWSLRLKHPLMRKTFPIPLVLKMIKSLLLIVPEGKRVISCKWIFKRKEGIPGVESTRNKARFVVRGFD